jgi:hypothetical protein
MTPAPKPVLGPNPVKQGQLLCVVSNTSAWVSSEWTVYGVDLQVVARLHFGAEKNCFTQTDKLAPGVYIIKIKVTDASGGVSESTKRVVVKP